MARVDGHNGEPQFCRGQHKPSADGFIAFTSARPDFQVTAERLEIQIESGEAYVALEFTPDETERLLRLLTKELT